jgi:hypothetical protein
MIKIVRRCQTATASRDVISVVRASIAYADVLLPILEAPFAHGRAEVVVGNGQQEHGIAVLTTVLGK